MGTHQGIAEPSLEVHLRLTAGWEPVIPKVSCHWIKVEHHDGIIRNLEYHNSHHAEAPRSLAD
jgi:hypothetical protein